VWALILIGSLAASVALDRAASSTSTVGAAASADALTRYGFRLEHANEAAGIDFVHEAPVFDSRLEHIMPQIASTGASVAVADFDRDGWQDFYVTNSGENTVNRLYRNRGDGTFVNVAGEVGLADVNVRDSGVSMGAIWGDYDNDGYEDLFLYKYGRPVLFRNEAGRAFRPVDVPALPDWVNANSAVWLDFNRDGLLDLFLAGYWSEDVNLWSLETTRIMPESFEYANNGGRKYLLKNLGSGNFEDVTEAMGITSRRWTLAVVAADLFGTGFPDLFLSNDYGVSELYRNQAGERFVDVGGESGVGRAPKSGMNASVGDVFNDGRLSIYKTNISEPGVLVQANDLWVPTEAGGFDNLAATLGIDLGGWSWGAQFGDLNNDGTLDIYLTNGYVSADDRASYWYDFSTIAVGHSAIIGDAANWPAMRGRSLSGFQRKRVWLNDGRGRFSEVAQVVGASDVYDGRAVALADLSNKGALDVLVANQKGPLLFYRNTTAPGRHWIAFELEGTASNRSAIGARVELHWNGQVQAQEIHGGSGFSAQNQRVVHYGLGSASGVDRVVVRWPSGRSQTVERPAIDTRHKLVEQ